MKQLADKVLDELAKIKADERLSYPNASVYSNAPLALMQVDLKARVQTLEWVARELGVLS